MDHLKMNRNLHNKMNPFILPKSTNSIQKISKSERVLSSLSKTYNFQKKTELGRLVKSTIIHAFQDADITLQSMKNKYGFKMSNTTYSKTQNQPFLPRKKNQNKEELYHKIEEFVFNFLQTNSKEAANDTVSMKDRIVPARILNDSKRALYSKLKKTDFYVSLQKPE